MIETVDTERRKPGRPSRAEVESRAATVTTERRRRRGGALDLGSQLKLGLPEHWYAPGGLIDREQWVSRFVNDEDNRLHFLSTSDDYDFVEVPEGREAEALNLIVDTKSDSRRVSVPVGTKKDGTELRAYLMRKPRAYWEDDQAELMADRADQERSRIMGDDISADGGKGIGRGVAYVPQGNSLKRAQVSVADYQP